MPRQKQQITDSVIQSELEAEITQALYASGTKSLLISIAVALLLVYIQSSVITKSGIMTWLSIFMAVYLARYCVVLAHQCHIAKNISANQWLQIFRISTAICGAAWGLAGILLFPIHSIAYQAFLMATLMGVCGGAIIVYSVEKLTSIYFSGALMLIALPSFLTNENTISFSMAIMLILFCVYTTTAGLSNGKLVRESITHKIKSRLAQIDIDELSQRQKLHIENTPLGVIEWSADFKVRSWNAAAELIFGYSANEAVGQHGLFLVKPTLHAEMSVLVDNLLKNVGYHHSENENIRKDGKTIYCAWFNTPIINNNKVVGFASLVEDKTAEKEAHDEIQRLAYFDTLTNLPNRRLLQDRLIQAQEFSARHKSYACAMYVDLDNFKALNDSKGHSTGDILLRKVAKRLQKLVRNVDTVARIGGDEFVLIFSQLGKTLEEAELVSKEIAEKLIAEINKPFMLHGNHHHCTSSLGICLFLGKSMNNSEILKRADTAMYEVKYSGRNHFKVFDEASQPMHEMRANLKNDVQHALSDKQLELYYQVQVDAAGLPIGAECLLRWHHPQYGTIPPAQFIPLVEESGQILPIGSWVIQHACKQLKAWESSATTNKLALSVNISAIQLAQVSFVPKVKQIITEVGCQANLLTLELTESTILQNIEETITKMHALKALGITISMDDFGVGYSSFSALKRLPIDELKIDRSFIQDDLENMTSATIVKSIIDLGKNIGLKVVAEGVENQDQLHFLRSCYCKTYQGFLFGKPDSIDDFERSLEQYPISIKQLRRHKPSAN
ncbi:MAG: EAL domain-containing protein [Pseudomonadota bacterium]